MSYVLTIFYLFYFSAYVLPEELKTASGIKAVLLNIWLKGTIQTINNNWHLVHLITHNGPKLNSFFST